MLIVNGKYYLFVGANGPCSVSINIGGKIFRAHHDEVAKGLISTISLDAANITEQLILKKEKTRVHK